MLQKTKKIKIKRSEKVRYVNIPTELYNDLLSLKERGLLTQSLIQKSIRFIANIQYTSYNSNHLFDEWVHKSYNYLVKLFGPSYKKQFLQILIDNNIIECNKYYSQILGICMQYKINSKYYIRKDKTNNSIENLDSSKINFDTYLKINKISKEELIYTFTNIKEFKTIPYKSYNRFNSEESQYRENDKNQEFLDKFKEDFETLNIDYDKLREIAFKKISSLTIKDLSTNGDIKKNFFPKLTQRIGLDSFSYKCSLPKALEKVKFSTLTLIKDKKSVYLTNADEYIESKKNAMTLSYFGAIERLEKGFYSVGRNKTNNRLDTNLTNLSSVLVDYICESNNLIQFDASNSQFAILGLILSKDNSINQKKDYLEFKSLVASGKIYEALEKEFRLENRNEAKTLLFEVLFSSRTEHDAFGYLKEKFPNVINWIKKYKKVHGSKNFPIMLQQEEAKIFIDQLYLLLKAQGYFCLTKHDSLIVREQDKEIIEKTITQHFSIIGFECNLTSK